MTHEERQDVMNFSSKLLLLEPWSTKFNYGSACVLDQLCSERLGKATDDAAENKLFICI